MSQKLRNTNYDGLVKSLKTIFFVIPVKTGIQYFQSLKHGLDAGFHRNDDFLRVHRL